MNRLKVYTPTGRAMSFPLKQNAPRYGRRDQMIYTAAAVKERLLARGYTLRGVRQK